MQVTQTPFTIADFCAAMDRKEVTVNFNYQRSPKVWPPPARSFLIETVLLGYPMPKLSLAQNTDVKTRKTIKEIVDGQQRSIAIYDFFHDRLRLSRKADFGEAAGHVYSELTDELKHAFLSYPLSVDLFTGATPEDIREVFRRMNSYTVPLNSEEKRHARFQGDFKWFVYRLTRSLDKTFLNIGTFTEKQLNRMTDAKLLSEVTHAFENGIQTTKANELDKLYSMHDKSFDTAEALKTRIIAALEYVVTLEPLHSGPLMKSYNLYALLLAVMHRSKAIPALTKLYSPKAKKTDAEFVLPNLSGLAAAADDVENAGRFTEFAEACAEKTNVAAQRQARFIWLSRALESELL